jgi:tryptophan synthase alpha subunit
VRGSLTALTSSKFGIPYSDPVMDGVTIQRAGTRALERGTGPGTHLRRLKPLRTPAHRLL